VRGSDVVVRLGRISKQGSAWLRWVLIEAAQTAKRSAEFVPRSKRSPAAAARRSPPPRSPQTAPSLPSAHLLAEADDAPAGKAAACTTQPNQPLPAHGSRDTVAGELHRAVPGRPYPPWTKREGPAEVEI
jgi:hypothetical protein